MSADFWYGVLVGWIAGMGFMLSLWWRPAALLRRQGAEIRRLRAALEDSDRQLSGQFQAAERMARLVIDDAAKRMRP